ncbi:MAG: hypothetical protein AAFO83_05750 [Cyanobacteria bacterium J06607_13]
MLLLVKAIAALLDELITWPSIEQLEFLISTGTDPFTQLQVRLDRQILSWTPTQAGNPKGGVMPSDICQQLDTQRIYVFSRHD